MADVERFSRQQNAFPDDRRQRTSIVVLNAAAAPAFTRMLLAGAAAMGVPDIAVDGYSAVEHPHFLRGAFRRVVETIAPEADYRVVRADDCGGKLDTAWFVVVGRNLRTAGLEHVEALARRRVRILLAWVSETAVSVEMVQGDWGWTPACLRPPPAAQVPAPMELNILAAGLCLDAIIRGVRPAGEGESDYSGHYDLCLPRRIPPADAAASHDNAAPAGAPSTFRRRRLVLVGAGALSNWVAISPALEGANLTIYDGDPEVAVHNLNRQILLVNGVGSGRPKAEVLTDELRRMQPLAQVEAHSRFVRCAADLNLDGADALVCVPDNDEARLVCADAARRRGLLYGTAGSSAVGGQITVVDPGRACYRCVTGISA